MFKFNTKNHTAVKMCFDSKELNSCAVDRHFRTKAEMMACPEFQAFATCKEAYNMSLSYINEEIANKLQNEVLAWKNSAYNLQAPVDMIEWKLDDYYLGGGMVIILQNRKFTIKIDKNEEKIRFFDEDGYEFAAFAYYAYKADLGHFYVTNGVTKLWFTFAK